MLLGSFEMLLFSAFAQVPEVHVPPPIQTVNITLPSFLPLPNIPGELQDHVLGSLLKPLRTTAKADFLYCQSVPDSSSASMNVAQACIATSDAFATFLNDAKGHTWGAKHGYIVSAQGIMDAARKRACSLGSSEGCRRYADSLTARDEYEQACPFFSMSPCKPLSPEESAALQQQIAAQHEAQRQEAAQQCRVRTVSSSNGYSQTVQDCSGQSNAAGVLNGISSAMNQVNDQLAHQTADRQEQDRASQTQLANISAAVAGDAQLKTLQVQVQSKQAVQIAAAPTAGNPSLSTTQVSGVVVSTLCPATGFVPGVMIQKGDTAAGVPCRPGSAIYVNGVPQFSMTAATSAITSGSGANASTGTSVPVGGSTITNPAQCHDMAFVVQLDAAWTNPKKTEVVGFFTNNTISEVTCTWAFHKNGQWTEYGQGYIHAGAVRQGGEQGGVWTVGADSSSMKYACYEGKDPVDVSGRSCNANLVFTGLTMAGTDK